MLYYNVYIYIVIDCQGTYHGCRYLYVDQMLTAVQASPQNKVATLSSESLELMASAREQLQAMSQQQVSAICDKRDPSPCQD